MKKQSMKRKIIKTIVFGLFVSMALNVGGCSSESNNGNSLNASVSEIESNSRLEESPESESLEMIQETESESEEITIATLGNITDSKERLNKAKEFYEEVAENYAERTNDAVLLLKTMAECSLGETVDTARFELLKEKMDELMQKYQGNLCEVAFSGSGKAEISVLDDTGRLIAFYNEQNDVVKTYHCASASNVKNIDLAGKVNPSSSSLPNTYWWGRELAESNAKDFEFEYDDMGRPISIKWKAYQTKSDGSITNNWKMAEFKLSYRDDGHLKEAWRTGYEWGVDKGGDYAFLLDNIKYTFDSASSDYVKVDVLGYEDGSCQIIVQNHANEANYVITHRNIGDTQRFLVYESNNLYYDLASKRIRSFYSVENLENGFTLLRKFNVIYVKNHEPEIDKITESTRYLIYCGSNATGVDLDILFPQLY